MRLQILAAAFFLTLATARTSRAQLSFNSAVPGSRFTPAQKSALMPYAGRVETVFSAQEIPSSINGSLFSRVHPDDPAAEAHAALLTLGAAFRTRPDDGFEFSSVDTDKNGVLSVRMTQTYSGLPVIGAGLAVRMDATEVTGINGRFVADLNVSNVSAALALSREKAAAVALEFSRDNGIANPVVTAIREPAIWVDDENSGYLAIPVEVRGGDPEAEGLSTVMIDAAGVRVLSIQRPTPEISLAGGGSTNFLRNPQFEYGDNGDWSTVHLTCDPWDNCISVHPPNIVVAGARKCEHTFCIYKPPRSGQYVGWLNGYGRSTIDSLYQMVNVPTDAVTGTLTFYVRVDSSEGASWIFDTLTVQARLNWIDLTTPLVMSNRDAPPNPVYVKKTLTFDASKARGQAILISFLGKENYVNQTSFVIDDTSLTFTHAFVTP